MLTTGVQINDQIRIHGVRIRRCNAAHLTIDRLDASLPRRRFFGTHVLCPRSHPLHHDYRTPAKRPWAAYPANCRQTRLVHTQAAREITEQSEALEIGGAQIQDNNQAEQVEPNVVRDKPPPPQYHLDKLFKALRDKQPFGTPTARIRRLEASGRDDGSDQTEEFLAIELVSDECGIYCVQDIVASEQTQTSIDRVFGNLVQQYVEQLTEPSKLNNLKESVRGSVLNHLHTVLDLAPVTPQITTLHIDPQNPFGPQLFRVQMCSGNERLGEAQVWPNASVAERLAAASANIEILRRAEQQGLDLEMFSAPASPATNSKEKLYSLERLESKSESDVYDVSFSEDCVIAVIQTLREARLAGLPDEVKLKPISTTPTSISERKSTGVYRNEDPLQMKTRFLEEQSDPVLRDLRAQRDRLPIRQAKTSATIRKLINENDVLVLVSETGSGKTTQLPQLILEEQIMACNGPSCNVICTQPRRIAATSVAARVATERGTYVGGSVGYKVRFDHRLPTQKGGITYSTAGVLLRLLQVNAQKVLDETSHILIDEVHERDLTADLLMAILRDAVRTRLVQGKKCPKIILMSATMNSVDFERYFAEQLDGCGARVASITIPGRNFPVTASFVDNLMPVLKEFYADDKHAKSLLRESLEYLEWEDQFADEWGAFKTACDKEGNGITERALADFKSRIQSDPSKDAVLPFTLIVLAIAHAVRVSDRGDVLVFLPGMKELDHMADLLKRTSLHALDFEDPQKFRLFKLHSKLYETNSDVFGSVPEGCRRIILSTDIAQTSVTLPDVVHVIDSGKKREMKYDPVTRRNEFFSTWIDMSSSLQRKGRAGRLQAGHYWAMFTEARFQSMSETGNPTILISDLTAPSLLLKSQSDKVNLADFFARTINPPNPAAVAACIQELQEMGMLTAEQNITPLGQFCSDFPLHPAKARGLVMGVLFQCLEPMMILASHDANSPLIYSSANRKDMTYASIEFAGSSDDDRYAFIRAFQEYARASRTRSMDEIEALETQHVRSQTFNDMLSVGRQLYGIMADYGLLPSKPAVRAALLSRRTSAFAMVPVELNKHSHRVNLFKAIALTAMETNLAVWHEAAKSWRAKDIKCILRPYSVNTKQSLKIREQGPYRMNGETMGFADMVRSMASSPRPFLVETSNVTPLMAMLFGGPIAVVGEDIIEVDGWLRYKLTLDTATATPGGSGLQIRSLAMLVLELRKALDRFLILAFSELKHVSRLNPEQRRWTLYNRILRPSPLSGAIVSGLIRILKLDVEHWEQVVNLARPEAKEKRSA